MFFMPEKGATFYLTGRLQYFWVYFSQFRVPNDMSVKKIGCDNPTGIEMTPMAIITLTMFPGGSIGQTSNRDASEGAQSVGNRMLSTCPQSRVGPARFT